MRHIISILIENEAGALSRVAGLFSARGYNIETLTVAPTEDQSLSRLTIVTSGSDEVIEQINKQLNKLVDVIKLRRLPPDEIISRELMLIKVKTNSDDRGEIMDIAKIMGAKVSDITTSSMTIEIADTADRLQTILNLLAPYGIKEVVRTGTIALQKGSDSISV